MRSELSHKSHIRLHGQKPDDVRALRQLHVRDFVPEVAQDAVPARFREFLERDYLDGDLVLGFGVDAQVDTAVATPS